MLSLLELKLSGVSPIMFIPQESRDFSDLLTAVGRNGNVIVTENLSVILEIRASLLLLNGAVNYTIDGLA
ncbi:hypothetical protein HM131_02650 [Halobacillus mangrovi]|uniref:Uncharacterized protein n=1 Tax=Halobacillus mangrovi TaxID=402384 RepID=A0A1W5ZR73_9BACI|nr:hypothetical protein HM131_02650 [Halobacillus mangrovi]